MPMYHIVVSQQYAMLVCHRRRPGLQRATIGDPFELPRELGMLQKVESGSKVTVHLLADRIWEHAEAFKVRQQQKEAAERTPSPYHVIWHTVLVISVSCPDFT